MVVEVACSLNPSKLDSDIRYWLGDSNGDVQLVITIEINHQKPEIEVETWEYAGAAGKLRVQRIFISKTGNNNISVDGSPLTIAFSKLFLRQPDSNDPREGDITLDAAKLELFVSNVWLEQGF